MVDYNGFTTRERTAAGEWLRGELRAGRRSRPTECAACGQARGVLELHSEDYRQPFGDHVGQFPLCYRCHTMLHCRTREPAAWNAYRARVRAGWRYPPAYRRDFGRYVVPLLRRHHGLACTRHDLRRPVLDELAAGTYRRRSA